jgi:hypothetical protein
MTSDNLKYVIQQFVARALPAGKARTLHLPTDTWWRRASSGGGSSI